MEDNNNLENKIVEDTGEAIVSEEATNVVTEANTTPVYEEPKKKKKKKKLGRIITDFILFLLFIVIVFEIVIGVVNMNRISDEKEPVWYLSSKKVENELKTEVTYNLGLYKIVKTDTSKKTTVSLKPFFFGD